MRGNQSSDMDQGVQPSSQVTRLLTAWCDGDEPALESLTPLIYEELRRLARRSMRRERPEHTLQSTALVHEAYLRLVGQDVKWNGRNHFFAIAAQMMRRILVDHARAQAAEKRGAGYRGFDWMWNWQPRNNRISICSRSTKRWSGWPGGSPAKPDRGIEVFQRALKRRNRGCFLDFTRNRAAPVGRSESMAATRDAAAKPQ